MQEDKTVGPTQAMLDFLVALLKWRKFIFGVTIVGTILAIIIAFLIPKTYITVATVRGAPSGGLNVGSLLQSSGGLSGLGALGSLAMPQSGGQSDYLIAILESRLVQDAMIEKFDLKRRYKTDKIEDTRDALKGNTVIGRNVFAEIVSIGVYDEDPRVAADLTNFYVEMLNKVYTEINSQTARNNRENLEIRYNQTRLSLSLLEDSLRTFQEEHGVYSISAQTEAAVKSAASLKSELLLKEVELGVKRKVLGSDSPEITRLVVEIDQLNKAFNEMITGGGGSKKGDIFIPFAETPSVGLSYARLFRDVQIQTELEKVLLPLLEQARLQEQRETPSIAVIDKGVVPTKKSKPPRMLIALIGLLSSFILSSVVALMVEHLHNVKATNPERYEKIELIYDTIARDVRFWRRGT